MNMLLCGMGPWRDFLEVPKSPTNVMKLLQSKSTWRSLPSPVSLSNTARFDLGGSGVVTVSVRVFLMFLSFEEKQGLLVDIWVEKGKGHRGFGVPVQFVELT